jgi:CTP synthase
VIQNIDVESVYQLPLLLEDEGLAHVICRKLGLQELTEPDLNDWQLLMLKDRASFKKIRIALVGKYVVLHDAYLSVLEALKHAGIELGTRAEIIWVNAEDLEKNDPADSLADADAIIVPGGFGPRGMEGMVQAAGYARMNNVPFLGIGLGMQMAVVEFARRRTVWRSRMWRDADFYHAGTGSKSSGLNRQRHGLPRRKTDAPRCL